MFSLAWHNYWKQGQTACLASSKEEKFLKQPLSDLPISCVSGVFFLMTHLVSLCDSAGCERRTHSGGDLRQDRQGERLVKMTRTGWTNRAMTLFTAGT